jgi:hypothetical protein
MFSDAALAKFREFTKEAELFENGSAGRSAATVNDSHPFARITRELRKLGIDASPENVTALIEEAASREHDDGNTKHRKTLDARYKKFAGDWDDDEEGGDEEDPARANFEEQEPEESMTADEEEAEEHRLAMKKAEKEYGARTGDRSFRPAKDNNRFTKSFDEKGSGPLGGRGSPKAGARDMPAKFKGRPRPGGAMDAELAMDEARIGHDDMGMTPHRVIRERKGYTGPEFTVPVAVKSIHDVSLRVPVATEDKRAMAQDEAAARKRGPSEFALSLGAHICHQRFEFHLKPAD